MTNTIRITIDLALPNGWEDQGEQRVLDAAESLADIMMVQAEDGLWTLGSPDTPGSDHVLHWGTFSSGRSFTTSVQFVDLDDESSASRQHWVDTGRYLPKHCLNCADGVCHHQD